MQGVSKKQQHVSHNATGPSIINFIISITNIFERVHINLVFGLPVTADGLNIKVYSATDIILLHQQPTSFYLISNRHHVNILSQFEIWNIV